MLLDLVRGVLCHFAFVCVCVIVRLCHNRKMASIFTRHVVDGLHLSIGDGSVGHGEVGVIYRMLCLEHRSYCSIGIQFCHMSTEVADNLVQVLRDVTFKRISLDNIGADPGLNDMTGYIMDRLFLPDCPLVESLYSLYTRLGGVQSFHTLSNLVNLRSLRMADAPVNASVLRSIGDHPGLEEIKLYFRGSTVDIVRFFERLCDHAVIKNLSLGVNELSGVDFARFFQRSRKLEFICIFARMISKEQIVDVIRCAAVSETLSDIYMSPAWGLSSTRLTAAEVLRYVRGHRTLRVIHIPMVNEDYSVLGDHLQLNTCWRTRVLVYLVWCKRFPVELVRCMMDCLPERLDHTFLKNA